MFETFRSEASGNPAPHLFTRNQHKRLNVIRDALKSGSIVETDSLSRFKPSIKVTDPHMIRLIKSSRCSGFSVLCHREDVHQFHFKIMGYKLVSKRDQHHEAIEFSQKESLSISVRLPSLIHDQNSVRIVFNTKNKYRTEGTFVYCSQDKKIISCYCNFA